MKMKWLKKNRVPSNPNKNKNDRRGGKQRAPQAKSEWEGERHRQVETRVRRAVPLIFTKLPLLSK
jgi:hypothetical protein